MLDLGQSPTGGREPDEVATDYDRVESNLDELAATPTVHQFQKERRSRIRGQRLFLGLLVLVVLGGYLFTYIVAQDVGRTSARAEILDSTVSSLVAANVDREARGLPAIPVEDIVARLQDQGLVQVVTAAVIAQIDGDPRLRGSPGVSGPGGAAGTPGALGLPGDRGLPGANGIGLQGFPGTPGVEGPQGVQGGQGTQGVQGDPGVPGAPGETCPAGQKLQPIQVFVPVSAAHPDGTADLTACQ